MSQLRRTRNSLLKACKKPLNSIESHVALIFKILNLPLLVLKMCLIGSQEAQKAIVSKSHFAPKMAPVAILTFFVREWNADRGAVKVHCIVPTSCTADEFSYRRVCSPTSLFADELPCRRVCLPTSYLPTSFLPTNFTVTLKIGV